jgi:hypothetical protein
MDNLKSINRNHYGVDVIMMAYRKDYTLNEAAKRIECSRQFRGYHLPRQVDAMRVLQYL